MLKNITSIICYRILINISYMNSITNNFNGTDMFKEWKRGIAKRSYEMERTRKKKTR